MITKSQVVTVERLRALGYTVDIIRRVKRGVWLVNVQRRLTTGQLPLRVYPDGSYSCPWYDQHTPHSRRPIAWQS